MQHQQPAVAGAVAMEHVEALDQEPLVAIDLHASFPQRMDVVELQHDGQRDELAARSLHAVRLLVVDPVADVPDAGLREQLRGTRGLPVLRTHPAGRGSARGLHQRLDRGAYVVALFALGHPARDHSARRHAVTDQLAAARLAVTHESRVVLRGERIHRHRGRDAVPGQYIEDPKDPDPVAVLAMGETRIVGKRPWPESSRQLRRPEASLRRLPLLVVEAQEHAQRHSGLIGPAQHAAGGDRRPRIVLVIHAGAALRRHPYAPLNLVGTALSRGPPSDRSSWRCSTRRSRRPSPAIPPREKEYRPGFHRDSECGAAAR